MSSCSYQSSRFLLAFQSFEEIEKHQSEEESDQQDVEHHEAELRMWRASVHFFELPFVVPLLVEVVAYRTQ